MRPGAAHVEVRLLRPCIVEVGTIEDRPRKINMPNVGAFQVGARQISSREG